MFNFFTVQKLLTRANANPTSATHQASLYKRLLNSNSPATVITRFESKKYASNDECASYYVVALLETNQIKKIAPLLQGKEPNQIYVHAPAPTSKRPSLLTIISLSSLALLTYHYLSTSSPSSTGIGGISFSTHKKYKETDNPTLFDDVKGCDDAKEELVDIVNFLKNPEAFERLDASLPKGVLLVGPPGTGKTLLARAVAGEAGVPFFYASASEFDQMFVGVGAMRIRELFKAAKESGPSIIFIDEIDAVGGKRSALDVQSSRMSLNQLLTEMDGFGRENPVIVLAATNFVDNLDPALMRPGRFDSIVPVTLPNMKGRGEILQLYLKSSPLSKDVNIEVLARGTVGFSGADLHNMTNQAKILATKSKEAVIGQHHLEEAKDIAILGKPSTSTIMSDREREITAYHEAGHAIVAYYGMAPKTIHKATIMPRSGSLGLVSRLPIEDRYTMSKRELLENMDIAMGGRLAEEMLLGSDNVCTGASSDLHKATEIAESIVCKYGMSNELGLISFDAMEKVSEQGRQNIEKEIQILLKESESRARSLLMKRRWEWQKLAKALLDREVLSGEEIESLLG